MATDEFIYKFEKTCPCLDSWSLGHTSLTKPYCHGSATERERNGLSFRSREHSPGHLLEDLQDTSGEATVRAAGEERRLPVPSLHSYQPPLHKHKALVLPEPQSERQAEGAVALSWRAGRVCGVMTAGTGGSMHSFQAAATGPCVGLGSWGGGIWGRGKSKHRALGRAS